MFFEWVALLSLLQVCWIKWSKGYLGCTAPYLTIENLNSLETRMSALSQSVSMCFQYSWSTQHSSIATVLLKLNAKFIKDVTAWGPAVCECVCIWRELQQACSAAATAIFSMRDIKPPNITTGILNHLSLKYLQAGWPLQALFTVVKSNSFPLSHTPFLIITGAERLVSSVYLSHVT